MRSNSLRRPLFIASYTAVIIGSLWGPRALFLQPLIAVIGGLLFLVSVGQMIRIHGLFPEKHEKPSDFPRLITWGPFSLCRHPFYFWSLVNLLSIPIMLGSIPGVIAWAVLLPLWILLMRTEEGELISYWGDKYRSYMESTPMLPTIQSIKRYLRRRH